MRGLLGLWPAGRVEEGLTGLSLAAGMWQSVSVGDWLGVEQEVSGGNVAPVP